MFHCRMNYHMLFKEVTLKNDVGKNVEMVFSLVNAKEYIKTRSIFYQQNKEKMFFKSECHTYVHTNYCWPNQ